MMGCCRGEVALTVQQTTETPTCFVAHITMILSGVNFYGGKETVYVQCTKEKNNKSASVESKNRNRISCMSNVGLKHVNCLFI